jgi:hypothetical protein
VQHKPGFVLRTTGACPCQHCSETRFSDRRELVTFTANFIGQTGDDCSYQIEERSAGELVRAFIVTISCSQRASARGWEKDSDERKIELWCKHHSRELPKDGERIQIDLDEVTKG